VISSLIANHHFSYMLNLVAGGAMILAFAPWSWYAIAVLALACVLHNWLQHNPRVAFKCGAAFGFSYMLGSSYWIYYSLHDYGQAPVFLAVLATIIFAAILSLFTALLAAGLAWLRRYYSKGWLYLIIFPATWVLMEWSKITLAVGFPWNLLGQAIVDTPWRGILPILGVLGGSAVIALCAASIVYFLQLPATTRILFGGSVGLLLSASTALQLIEWTSATQYALKASVIQANIPQQLKFDKPYFDKLMNRYVDMSRAHIDDDLIVWPETAIPLYADMLDRQLVSLREQLKDKAVLLTGIFYRDKVQGKRYNSLMNVNDNHFYHKQRLVPFGEYIPMRSVFEIFSKWIIIPMSDLHSMDMRPNLTIGDHNAGVSICYEVAFGSDVADSLPAANFLVNVSNDSWFGDSLAPYQMLQMARVRSAESERYMVRATNTGISAIIDYRGRIVARSGLFEMDSISHNIAIREESTPYMQWRDTPIMLWVIVSLLVAWFAALPATKKTKELSE